MKCKQGRTVGTVNAPAEYIPDIDILRKLGEVRFNERQEIEAIVIDKKTYLGHQLGIRRTPAGYVFFEVERVV